MGGGTSLASQQQLAQSALAPAPTQQQSVQDQYYQLMNQLTQQQIQQGSQTQVGVPLSQFGSMGGTGFGGASGGYGYSPQSVDPWSYGGGGFGYG